MMAPGQEKAAQASVHVNGISLRRIGRYGIVCTQGAGQIKIRLRP